ncbi:hypothetical protein DNTS_023845, partial [Danionella cerebrum]
MGQRSSKVHQTAFNVKPIIQSRTSQDNEKVRPRPQPPLPVERPAGDARGSRGAIQVGADGDHRVRGKLEERRSSKRWRKLFCFITGSERPESRPKRKPGRRTVWTARSSDEYIHSHYSVGEILGKGGFGEVFEGRRLVDGVKVALKYVEKSEDTESLLIPGQPEPLPKEIALTLLANEGPSVPQIVRLLEWQDHPDHYVMVLECPAPCLTLGRYMKECGGRFDETTARQIMWQVVHAANTCCRRKVFHRDITLGNLLINTATYEVKLIDFGCGEIVTSVPYRSYTGTFAYAPPEYFEKKCYFARSCTVWSLGVLLFAMLMGRFPRDYDLYLLRERRWFEPQLSNECRNLLRRLLQHHRGQRLALRNIQSHKWFKCGGCRERDSCSCFNEWERNTRKHVNAREEKRRSNKWWRGGPSLL